MIKIDTVKKNVLKMFLYVTILFCSSTLSIGKVKACINYKTP